MEAAVVAAAALISIGQVAMVTVFLTAFHSAALVTWFRSAVCRMVSGQIRYGP